MGQWWPRSYKYVWSFLEVGPLRITKGDGDDDYVIGPAEQAWTDSYNIVFLDQPVNTGFSYGNTTLNSMQEGATEFMSFLTQFLNMYPELKQNDFHLTGESYAGKYLPLFAYYVLEYNKITTNFKINFKST